MSFELGKCAALVVLDSAVCACHCLAVGFGNWRHFLLGYLVPHLVVAAQIDVGAND